MSDEAGVVHVADFVWHGGAGLVSSRKAAVPAVTRIGVAQFFEDDGPRCSWEGGHFLSALAATFGKKYTKLEIGI